MCHRPWSSGAAAGVRIGQANGAKGFDLFLYGLAGGVIGGAAAATGIGAAYALVPSAFGASVTFGSVLAAGGVSGATSTFVDSFLKKCVKRSRYYI